AGVEEDLGAGFARVALECVAHVARATARGEDLLERGFFGGHTEALEVLAYVEWSEGAECRVEKARALAAEERGRVLGSQRGGQVAARAAAREDFGAGA